MSVRLKVKDGTRPDKRLCDTCRSSTVLKGPQQGQEKVYCAQLGLNSAFETPFHVVECSGYNPKGSISEWEAKQIGWVLEVNGGKIMGFKPPKKEYENG